MLIVILNNLLANTSKFYIQKIDALFKELLRLKKLFNVDFFSA